MDVTEAVDRPSRRGVMVAASVVAVVLIAFIVANVCYSVAAWDRGRLPRAISIFFLLAAGLGVVSLLTSYGSGLLPENVMAVAYPTIQPVGRLLTGVWLSRTAEGAT